MKVFIYLTFFGALISFSNYGRSESYSAELAVNYSNSLAMRSPKNYDGLPLRIYQLQDINHDGRLEILEISNPIEESSEGFLNTEIYPAFDWVTIYSYKDKQYIESTEEFSWYLNTRKAHYELWVNLLKAPNQLAEDSKNLIDNNYDEFMRVLKSYIEKIEDIQSKR